MFRKRKNLFAELPPGIRVAILFIMCAVFLLVSIPHVTRAVRGRRIGEPVYGMIRRINYGGVMTPSTIDVSFSFGGREFTQTLQEYRFALNALDTIRLYVDPQNPHNVTTGRISFWTVIGLFGGVSSLGSGVYEIFKARRDQASAKKRLSK